MKSSIYIDDKFVGEVGANKLFTYAVTQTGDYYIKLVEKCTMRNYHLTKIANIKDSVDDILYVYPQCAETVNLFVFKINHNIGVVDCSGKIIIPPHQDEVRIESAELEDGCDYVFYVWKNDICHSYDKIGRFIKKYPKNQKIEKLRYFDDALTAYHERFESLGDKIVGAGWNTEID